MSTLLWTNKSLRNLEKGLTEARYKACYRVVGEGKTDYGKVPEIVITADCGGSNRYRNRLWKHELQQLSNEIEKAITILHYPLGTSKWNKIEHRLFAFITKNWQGIPLVSTAIVVSFIGKTTTAKGLSVTCILDQFKYQTGLKIDDIEFAKIHISNEEFHSEWNYTISQNA